MKKGVFVTGTDTNVGKTLTSALLVSSLLQSDRAVGYWKPVQTGTDSDRRTVLELTGLPSEFSPQARYEFPEPMAPSRAARIHGRVIEIEEIVRSWDRLPEDRFWIVEGAGGALVPLSDQTRIIDLISVLGLPVVLVAGTRLGTMNHLMLTLEALQSRGISVERIFFVGDEDPELEQSLAPWLDGRPTLRVPWLARMDRDAVARLPSEMGLISERPG